MKYEIREEYPPNYEEIKQYIDIVGHPAFPWGNIIYNPFKKEIPPDVIYHELVHTEQQGDNIEMWWKKYLMDIEFRFDQEREAYAKQYHFIKDNLGAKIAKEALDGLADDLSSDLYGLKISKSEAATFIRRYVV